MNLKAKFLVSTSAVILLTGIVVISLTKHTLFQKLKAVIQKEGMSVAQDIAEESVNLILTEDTLNLKMLIYRHKSHNKDLSFIIITNPKGNILAHTFTEGIPGYLKKYGIMILPKIKQDFYFQNAVEGNNVIYVISSPILEGRAGYAYVGIPRMIIEKDINEIISWIILIIIFSLIICIIVISFLNGVIMKPIIELRETAQKISSGSLSQRVKVKTKDELGRLGGVFNNMLDNLEKLTVSRDTLTKEIQERIKIESKMRYSEERYRNLINISPEGIMLLDSGLNIIMINRAGINLYGYAGEKEMTGINVSEFFEQEQMAIVQKNIGLAVQNGEVRDLELVSKKNGGNLFYIELSANLIADNEKDVNNILVIFSDISLRKKTEQELREAYDKLKELQSQLVQTEKMAAIGQLAGGVAHEINNPLTGVLNNVQLIKMLATGGNEFKIGEFRELLDIIEESAQRCQKITQSLLDFSHASMGQFRSISLNGIIEKVTDLISNELNLQNILINKELQPDLPEILGDSQLLQQVIINFFSNAKWAIQKRFKIAGGLITVKTENSVESGIVTVSITDNGIGIDESKIKKIFEPFFTTKDVGEGTGLGLSVAYNIIKKHKGTIEVESRVNVGTTFKLSIPSV